MGVKKLEEEEKYTVPIKSEDDSTIEGAGESKKKNKRKVKEEGEEGAELVAVKTKKSKRKRRSEAGLDGLEEVQAALQEIDDGPKIKKEEDEDSQMKDVTSEEAPKKQKKDKKDKKEKRDKKDKKAKKVKEESSASEEEISKEERRRLKKEKRKAKLDASASASESTTKESTPAVPVTSNSSGTSTPVLGRHLVRSRYIAQKKMASMDATALNQRHPILGPAKGGDIKPCGFVRNPASENTRLSNQLSSKALLQPISTDEAMESALPSRESIRDVHI
ncbi:hypothetical protein DH86_00000972 [Scytalidium sp. 3C]|nr:hypothetical protein DH86_00000972 [Scytalidium sp. 3C]